ncbi:MULTISPECIES: ATP-binding protein [unclassified Luteimonas]|uniref:ATP-binding protein n=1 Tax=unclassified Luteimonas TaxID=2629088 RepID=UPI0015FECB7C|nr:MULTISPECIES: ATP-binding protein [unclassified Luteimonas]MBB1472565.1 ATP-binding protein [Luteimonas sp. MC1782]MBB6598715.1 ATP-binding protein [Luteimonas sp. MC1825]QOC88882.1 ATP-binding protein [Luteimonas sp. MC1825]
MARKVHSRLLDDPALQAIVPRATLADLALPASAIDQLRQIVAQARHRTRVEDESGSRAHMSAGLGISALFAGESGTGKTMAAEVIASELGLPLYRIDLSAVVSKYIGETEKNLQRVFNAAEAGGAILFFDEADALFGKRSEVKDSHDRYANIEVSYLRRGIEGHQGIVILAVKARSALDAPFLRRLRFVVDFPVPGGTERRGLAQGAP